VAEFLPERRPPRPRPASGARGEVLEVAAALEIAALAGDCESNVLELATPIADRLYSLLTRLSR
jgi:hypothetical protein